MQPSPMKQDPRVNAWWHLRRAGASPYAGAVVALLALSTFLSFKTCSWIWMSRCGGVVVLFGVLLGFPRLLRMGAQDASQDNAPLIVRGNQVNVDAIWQRVQRLTDSYAQALGLVLIVLGTLLAGYGDLVFEWAWPLARGCAG